jgi:hypothetical protein
MPSTVFDKTCLVRYFVTEEDVTIREYIEMISMDASIGVVLLCLCYSTPGIEFRISVNLHCLCHKGFVFVPSINLHCFIG